MAFREKTAWIMSIALLLGGLFYWGVVIAGTRELGTTMPPLIPIIVVYVGLLVVISVVGHIGAALTSLKTANAPSDERETKIAARSTGLSDLIMGLGVMISLGFYLTNFDGNQLFHFVFGTLMTAQFVLYATQIVLFRQQSAKAD